jgi:acetyl-CoA carboxylase carboxyltransferase component
MLASRSSTLGPDTLGLVTEHSHGDAVAEATERARRGGAEKYHQKLAEQGKLFVRERLRLLLDDADSFVEDGLLTRPWPGTFRPTPWSPASGP